MVDLWRHEAPSQFGLSREVYLVEQAARWGADQEILACGNYLKHCAAWEEEDVIEFYNCRRPKPSSSKKQALASFQKIKTLSQFYIPDAVNSLQPHIDTVFQALEQLND
jgi:hypothetical protein